MTPPPRGAVQELAAHPRLSDTFVVTVDGESGPETVALPADIIVRHGIRPGLVIDDQLGRLIERELLEHAAFSAALRLIGVRARSRRELRHRLLRRNLPADAIDVSLERLERLGYLSDEQFARQWVGSRRDRLGLGKARLAYELREKGIDVALVRAVTDNVTPDEELQRAIKLARQRAERLSSASAPDTHRRLASFLVRKGYPPGIAYRAAREVLSLADDDTGIAPELDDD